ncbi:Countin-1-like [Oopsacas minuta]|uniref:Countin-1-like n=1 Tax=Oopsacas minuta TaxID=111878 RepID=A0AAV7KF28_9METZ|nr:Countin-1-like [Oopsacas minuta]
MNHLIEEVYKHKASDISDSNGKCKVCLDFVDNFIQDFLNIILNAGLGATCQDGCAAIAQKIFNGSQIVDAVCTIACMYEGIEEFVDLLKKIDIDPIYYCQELSLCAWTDNGNVKINSVAVQPPKAAQGSTFDITVAYTVINTTGTADLILAIQTVDKLPLENEFILYQQTPKQYEVDIKLEATPNQNCQDPICERWLPGVYIVDITICEAQCDSKHPHHKIYSKGSANFTITG